MRDIVITGKRQKAEILWILACFFGAILMNFFAIIGYKTQWNELYSQILWVLLITCVLYAISVGLRVALYLIKRLFSRKAEAKK